MAARIGSGFVLPERAQVAVFASLVQWSKLPPMPTPITTGGQCCEPAFSTQSMTYFSITSSVGKLKISSAAQRPDPSAFGEHVIST